MIELDAQEQAELDQLDRMHQAMNLVPGSNEEREHVRIMGSNGMISWKTHIVYAENHGCPVPHWVQEYRDHYGV